MSKYQKIPCQVCQAEVPFEKSLFLQGVSFSCPNCHSVYSLAPQSRAVVESAFEKFEKLKALAGKTS